MENILQLIHSHFSVSSILRCILYIFGWLYNNIITKPHFIFCLKFLKEWRYWRCWMEFSPRKKRWLCCGNGGMKSLRLENGKFLLVFLLTFDFFFGLLAVRLNTANVLAFLIPFPLDFIIKKFHAVFLYFSKWLLTHFTFDPQQIHIHKICET